MPKALSKLKQGLSYALSWRCLLEIVGYFNFSTSSIFLRVELIASFSSKIKTLAFISHLLNFKSSSTYLALCPQSTYPIQIILNAAKIDINNSSSRLQYFLQNCNFIEDIILSVSAKLFLSDSDTNQRREQVRGHPIYSLVPPNGFWDYYNFLCRVRTVASYDPPSTPQANSALKQLGDVMNQELYVYPGTRMALVFTME
jgi:hypothetical protein